MTLVFNSSPKLDPVFAEQALLDFALRQMMPNTHFEIWLWSNTTRCFAGAGYEALPDLHDPLVAVTDLHGPVWKQLRSALAARSTPALAVVPSAVSSVRGVPVGWECEVFDERPAGDDADLERLLLLASPALSLGPELLRALRQHFFPSLGVGVELKLWQSAALTDRCQSGGTFDPGVIGPYRDRSATSLSLTDDDRRQALLILRADRPGADPSLHLRGGSLLACGPDAAPVGSPLAILPSENGWLEIEDPFTEIWGTEGAPS
ncbi:MAG: hypothetical protein AAF713_19110 [Pseudomonadota bacterium]